MRHLTLSVMGLFLLSAVSVLAGTMYTESVTPPADATYVGSETCIDCHDDVGEFYTHSPHSPERALAIPGTDVAGCEACHGPGSLHVEGEGDGFIVTVDQFAEMSGVERVAMCTQCHTGHELEWSGGPHAGSEISCADCHADQVHFGGPVVPAKEYRNKAEFCLQCHADQVAEFRLPFRHRVLEGQLACQDCHDPHAGFPQTGWNGLNEMCLNCHTEMSGPFVFEHDGVSGEDCTMCHRPHGSNHDKLLSQEGNGLCLQCHFEPAFGSDDNWTVGSVSHGGLLGSEARCYDCHTDIHGSNVAPTFRDQ